MRLETFANPGRVRVIIHVPSLIGGPLHLDGQVDAFERMIAQIGEACAAARALLAQPAPRAPEPLDYAHVRFSRTTRGAFDATISTRRPSLIERCDACARGIPHGHSEALS